jgi:hypothetical protein
LPSFHMMSHTLDTVTQTAPWSRTGPDRLQAPWTHRPHSACSEDWGSRCHLWPAATQWVPTY